jgi:hypothetical protein
MRIVLVPTCDDWLAGLGLVLLVFGLCVLSSFL